MKTLFVTLAMMMAASVASANCGSQFGGRMFDNTNVKQRVAKSEDRRAPVNKSGNVEVRRTRTN